MAASDYPPDDSSGEPAPEGLPPVSPDFMEQELGGVLDDILPTYPQVLPMVGLGGSAGGIEALQDFFREMPAENGMAFVVILHLSPDYESALPEMLQRVTAMKVHAASDGMKVEPDSVYVIPPGKYLAASDGHLHLSDLPKEAGKRVAVDLFFRSLADSHGAYGTAIVLSGADGDGSVGLKRVKERGGLTIAQDPDEAQHPSMPRSAINTGMVDLVLRTNQMPAKLMAFRAREEHLRLPPEDGPKPDAARAAKEAVEAEDEEALRAVLTFLRVQTGRDFLYYKRATILRRLARRMQVNAVSTLPEYLDFMRTHSSETGALLQDLLISVTNFFRDRDSFDALEGMLPELFAGKKEGDTVRVWVAACATGEEAYSIAMMLIEHSGTMDSAPTVQVFATDLNNEAIASAREAIYPASIAADVSEERLRRFFAWEHQGFRVRRELRERVLFAEHDLLKDSSFSRLDLVSCRNLLIYLRRDAQKRALDIFHFALNPGALLFLGSSESIEDESTFFRVLDKKYRLFAQIPARRTGLPVPIGPSTLTRARGIQDHSKTAPRVHGPGFAQSAAQVRHEVELSEARAVSWEELHFKLIERFSPPSLIVDRDYEIVHISENASRFLRFASGEPSSNVLRLVTPALRIELRAALFRAAQSNTTVEVFRLPVELEGRMLAVDLRVCPAQEIAPDYLLVVFSERSMAESGAAAIQSHTEPAVRHLERENEQLKMRLRDTVEQYEASTEELKAGNEELQAMNEELRSATEELETGREELQSINEELTTVNQELKSNVDDLSHANSDLNNLMAATAIATIFLNRALRITRYTPSAVALFNLISSDIGRPLTDLTHRLNYSELNEDANQVLDTLQPVKREVSDGKGRWFLVRLLPYRTTEDHIAGIVLTFVEISEMRQAERALATVAAELERQARTFDTALSSIADFAYTFDTAGRFIYANRPLRELLGRTLEEMEGRTFAELDYPAELAEKLQRELEHVVATGEIVRAETPFTNPAGQEGYYEYIFQPVTGADGTVEVVAGSTRVITERKKAEAALQQAEEQLRLVVENAREYAIFSMDLQRRVTTWNRGAVGILGYSEAEIIGQKGDMIFTPGDRADAAPEIEAATAQAKGRAADERWHLRKDGTRFWGSGVMMAMHDALGNVIGLVKIFRDETEARAAKEALEQSKEELWTALQEKERARADSEAAGHAKDHFLAVLSHELRTPLTPVLMGVRTLGRIKDLPLAARETLAMIKRNVELEAHLIEDLLDVTRATRGKLEIQQEPLDLHRVIREAVDVAASDLEARKQALTVALDADAYELTGDACRLQQAMWNLLKNASKFTPEGGEIGLRTRNEPAPAEGQLRIVVEVSDSGIGFERAAANRIFEAFTQASEDITREFGGLGLGLSITKEIVEAHQGSIRAESAGTSKGAIFTITLPLAPGNQRDVTQITP